MITPPTWLRAPKPRGEGGVGVGWEWGGSGVGVGWEWGGVGVGWGWGGRLGEGGVGGKGAARC